MNHSPYAHDGLIGCATPQANPTVEAELRRLLPASCNLQMTRSVAQGSPQARLQAYFDQLEQTLERYGGMTLDAFGFACTASSYLLPPGAEHARTAALEDRFAYPVRTAAQALSAALKLLGARRLLIGSPYPGWIHERCLVYWEKAGFQVTGHSSAQPDMGDTSAIYHLDPAQVAEQLAQTLKVKETTGQAGADVLLITGTGLPTLPLRAQLQETFAMPVLSANLCLAWELLRLARPDSEHVARLERELHQATPFD